MRHIWFLSGWCCFGLAIVGAFVPLLPTTPFALLALACFSRCSPKLRAVIRNNRHLGPAVRDWERGHVIRPFTKVRAVLAIATSYGLTIYFVELPDWAYILLGVFFAGLSLFIITRRSDWPDDL